LSIKRKIISGGIWLFFERLISFSIGFGGSIVLARLLEPEDFGAVAMASSVFLIVGRLSAIGIGQELMRLDTKCREYRERVSTFFILNAVLVMLCLALSISIAYLTPLLSDSAKQVFWILATSWSVSTILGPARDLLQKNLRFFEVSLLNLGQTVIAVPIAVAMAYFGCGIWALVLPQSILLISAGCVGYFLAKPNLIWKVKLDTLAYLKSKAAGYVGLGITEESYEKGPDLLIGGFLGEQLLALYRRAYNVVSMLHNQLGVVIYQITYPIHANAQNAQQQWRLLELQTKITVYGLWPPSLIIAAYSEELVLFLYGEKWILAAQTIVYLMPFAVLWPWYHQWKGFCVAKGQIRYVAYVDFIKLAILVAPSYLLMQTYGVTGVLWALNTSIFFATGLLAVSIYRQQWFRLKYLIKLVIFILSSLLFLEYGRSYLLLNLGIVSLIFIFFERKDLLMLFQGSKQKKL
jgi:teichuronic acid exporter